MKIFWFILILIFFLISSCFFLSPKYKNFILITADALRQDYLECYGNNRIRTPNINKLAKEGIIFKNAFTPMPITLPSHTSMLYSRYPWEIDIFTNNDILTQNKQSLQERFKAAGFKTAAFTSLGVLQPFFGLSKGFDYYYSIPKSYKRPYLFADEVNEEVFMWLGKNYKSPFFIWIHYSDTHEPYVPKNAEADLQLEFNNHIIGKFIIHLKENNYINLNLKPGLNYLKFTGLKNKHPKKIIYKLRIEFNNKALDIRAIGDFKREENQFIFSDYLLFKINNEKNDIKELKLNFIGNAEQSLAEIKQNYALEVENIDKAIGELMQWLKSAKLYDGTLIIFLADHGEALGEKGVVGHESHLYLTQLRIPFIIKDGIHHGMIIKNYVSTLDIAPTVMAYFHYPLQKEWKGRNLLDIIKKNVDNSNEIIKSMAIYYINKDKNYMKKRFSIIKGDKHLIYSPDNDRYELYNIGEDLKEGKNLFNEVQGKYKLELIEEVKSFSEEIDKKLLLHKRQNLPSEIEEHLRSLGY